MTREIKALFDLYWNFVPEGCDWETLSAKQAHAIVNAKLAFKKYHKTHKQIDYKKVLSEALPGPFELNSLEPFVK